MSGNTKDLAKQLGPAKLQEDVINDALTLYGIDPKAKYSDDDGKKKAALQGMLRSRVEVQEALTGKPVDTTDLKRMTDELLSQSVQTPGSFWSYFIGGAPWASEKKLLDFAIGDIPAGQRKQIEDVLKRRGRPISDPAVLQFYQDYVAKTGHPPPGQ